MPKPLPRFRPKLSNWRVWLRKEKRGGPRLPEHVPALVDLSSDVLLLVTAEYHRAALEAEGLSRDFWWNHLKPYLQEVAARTADPGWATRRP